MAIEQSNRLASLRARVEKLGLNLFIDSDHEVYVSDPTTGKMLGVCMDLDDAANFVTDLEDDRRKPDAAKPTDATADDLRSCTVTDDEPYGADDDPLARSIAASLPTWRTWGERRQEIIDNHDVERAIGEALGAFHTIHGQAMMLAQDTTRDKTDWVLSIANAIIELSDAARDLLDRPGGWIDHHVPYRKLEGQLAEQISDFGGDELGQIIGAAKAIRARRPA
jgi:hypothetical protein